MSQADPEENGTTLPLRLDPAWGALIGTFLLASCLAGPVGLAVALVVLIVIRALSSRKPKTRTDGLAERRRRGR